MIGLTSRSVTALGRTLARIGAGAVERLRSNTGHRWAVAGLGLLLIANDGGRTPSASVDAWTFDVLLALPLMAVRRRPVPVFWLVLGLSGLQALLEVKGSGPFAVAVALYAVALHAHRRALAEATAATELLLLAGVVRAQPRSGSVTVFFLLSAVVVAACALGLYARARRDVLAGLVDRARRAEQDRDTEVVLAASAERTRIARDLHDIVAHSLSVMIALSDGAAYVTEGQPDRAQQAMQQTSLVGREALAEIRRVLGVLGEESAVTERDPLQRIPDLVDRFLLAGLSVTLRAPTSSTVVPWQGQMIAYRVVQEALTNVLKHTSQGTVVQVQVVEAEGHLQVTVLDDGSPRPDPLTGSGRGLSGMAERVVLHGGTLDAGPRESGGWQVEVRLPLNDRTPERRVGGAGGNG